MSNAPTSPAARKLKLAILSESPADEAAVAVLIEAVLRRPFTRVQPALRARGWPSVAQVLPSIVRHLHFNTDTDGLVVVVDSDDSVVHTAAHDAPEYYHPLCRMCQLRAIFRQSTKKLPPAHGRERVLRGVGVAVPAVEAWYLCGLEETVTEQNWIAGPEFGRAPYTRRELKQRVYGTERPNLQHETEIALREARRHAHDLRRLENDFPGFASLAWDLKSWPETS
ncbi:hypothetical protein [Rariglobus hedericola]|uniref:DUF4276 family protein n=1 Tax=Rariglobus hedericola TaxID=2597822 RepID=A0A556QQ91_9BACT|nr:hypothetical protein [Rariglobus hedericola]TSJ78783.1 hypothetical protein FPL22_05600 [Rariglobus hedericola]